MTDWRDRALCAGHPEPETWFPVDNETGLTAKTYCAKCPVQPECLDFALTYRPYGVFGGTTARDREGMGARPSNTSAADEIDYALRRAKAAALVRQGLSTSEVAARLGLSPAALTIARKRGRL